MSIIHSKTLVVKDSAISGSTSRVSRRIWRSDQSLTLRQSSRRSRSASAVMRHGQRRGEGVDHLDRAAVGVLGDGGVDQFAHQRAVAVGVRAPRPWG